MEKMFFIRFFTIIAIPAFSGIGMTVILVALIGNYVSFDAGLFISDHHFWFIFAFAMVSSLVLQASSED